MKHIVLFIALLSILLSSAACSKKPPFPPSALEAKSVLSTLREMVETYQKKQVGAFMDKVSKEYPERQNFSQSIAGVFTKYETIRLTVHYGKMLFVIEEKGNSKVTFNWDGEWQTAGGRIVKDGGRVSFIFDPKGKSLLSIEGKNPFIPMEKQQ